MKKNDKMKEVAVVVTVEQEKGNAEELLQNLTGTFFFFGIFIFHVEKEKGSDLQIIVISIIV